MKHSQEYVGQRPAWLTIPNPAPSAEVYRAILAYQQAEAAFDAKDATFKRTKAGRLREADIQAHKDAEREFYLAAKDPAKVVCDFKHEYFGESYKVFLDSLMKAFLEFGLEHEMQTTAVFNAIYEKYGQPDFYASCARLNYIKVTHGSYTHVINIQVNRRLDSIGLDEVMADGKIRGSFGGRIKARLAHRGWSDDRDNEPFRGIVCTYQEEMCPIATRDFAAILHDMSWIADGIAAFNEKHQQGYYNYDNDRDNVMLQAIGYDVLEIGIPDNPDEE